MIEEKGNVHRYIFDNVLEAVEYAEAGTGIKHYSNYKKNEGGFYGGTWKQALEQGKFGTYEVTKGLGVELEKLRYVLTTESKEYRRNVEGDFFDVGLVLAGEPESWYETDFQAEKPVVKIRVSCAMNCLVSTDVIRRRGAAIVALVEMLSQKYLIDLVVQDSGTYRDKKYSFDVNFKMGAFDVDAFAFAVANPLFHRRIKFALLEIMYKEKYCCSYGHPCDHEIDSDALHFESSATMRKADFKDTESAKKYVEKILKKFDK